MTTGTPERRSEDDVMKQFVSASTINPHQNESRPIMMRKCDELNAEILELEQNIDDLVVAIAPILGPHFDPTSEGTPREREPISDLAEWLTERTLRIKNLNAAIVQTRRRVEV